MERRRETTKNEKRERETGGASSGGKVQTLMNKIAQEEEVRRAEIKKWADEHFSTSLDHSLFKFGATSSPSGFPGLS